ncbi:MAG TPA: glycosyltransferase family 1 protein [Microvirga sp.]|nr:glycosyltransferase family 1 protein [Microvirga sp.]
MHERSTTKSHVSRPPSSIDARAPLLVCFSHLRWDFVWQRPQHLLSRAVKHYRVLFIEEPIFEPDIVPHLAFSVRPQGVTVAVPMLPTGLDSSDVVLEQRDLVENLLGRESPQPRIFWYYTPMAMAFTTHLECDLCVYDNMDELSLFRGASRELLDLETALFARADIVFTGGMSLYEAKRGRHRNVHAFPSSIEFDHFVKARSIKADPTDQAAIPGPRLGFFGVIDERMDVELLGQVAELRPQWQFVMIGPVVKIDPGILPRRDNIHWLGPKDYKDLPHYLSGWDVGFMNFALNEATRFISPTKTPEFLAAGVPVVSTPITDVVRPYGEKGLVEIAKTPLEVVRKAEILLERPKEPWLHRVDRHLAAGSWDKTWASMNKLMAEVLDGAATERSLGLPVYATTPAE